VNKQITPAPRPTPIPNCSVKMLAAALVKAGLLKTGQTLQVTLDPEFSTDSWIVQTPPRPSHFDVQTCAKKD
jgi:hypothetical protein